MQPMKGVATRFSLAALVALTIVSSAAEASQLWGVTAGNSTSIAVLPIDPATGATGTLVTFGGGLPFQPFYDLASDPVRYPSIVWGVRAGSVNELLAFDPVHRVLLSRKIMSPTTAIYGLAIDPTTGVMYGAGKSGLYRVARDTGEATFLGGTSSVFSALAFDAAGNLYSTRAGDILASIDKSTGAATDVATLTAGGLADMAARPEDGVMLALGAPMYNLYLLNLGSAAATLVGPSVGRGAGLAFTGEPSLPADFDGNGAVDYDDLARWHAGLGMAGSATRFEGDADGDFDVDGNDYLVWQAMLGRKLSPSADIVPEPPAAQLAVLALSLTCAASGRRRGR
jgi:hypothetical protein